MLFKRRLLFHISLHTVNNNIMRCHYGNICKYKNDVNQTFNIIMTHLIKDNEMQLEFPYVHEYMNK